MTIEEQRKLVDGLTTRAERQYKTGVINMDSHVLHRLSSEIKKLKQMEDAKRESAQ